MSAMDWQGLEQQVQHAARELEAEKRKSEQLSFKLNYSNEEISALKQSQSSSFNA